MDHCAASFHEHDADAFAKWLAPFRKSEWVVYAKPPFGGPEAVLAYLSRYTHRVAISNQRLVSASADTVSFRWKDSHYLKERWDKVLRFATQKGEEVPCLRLSHSELAELAGASREAVSKALSAWKKQGILQTSRESIELLNQAALREIAAV